MKYYLHSTDQTPAIYTSNAIQKADRICSDVVLGSPSSNCNGVGICRVMVAGDRTPSMSCPSISTWLSKNAQGRLQMNFPKQYLDRACLNRHFAWYLFTVAEPYRLSPRLCSALGITDPWIKPGIYRVFESEETLAVCFT
jgi:hypothetical protein